jgi:hypothetical protein
VKLADDEPDRFLEAAALIEASEIEPIIAEPPVCEGECAPYTGDLTVYPRMPLAVCDPFFDAPEDLLTDEEVAAMEAAAE